MITPRLNNYKHLNRANAYKRQLIINIIDNILEPGKKQEEGSISLFQLKEAQKEINELKERFYYKEEQSNDWLNLLK
jgi:hypothetical protein